jgi:hypothetical protein
MQNLLIGADPELFVTSNGALVSAHGMIPGTKAEPHPVSRGAVQVDGLALEFNIEPARDKGEFVTSVLDVMSTLRSMVPEKYDFTVEPAMTVPDDVLTTAPEEALELGCDPDFNAYSMNANERPAAGSTIRTAAGHVHVGWTDNQYDYDDDMRSHFHDAAGLTKQLDASLGLWSLSHDDDTVRRSMYGKAGAFRPKPYGMEYRVLSNFWLKSEELMEEVYDITKRAVEDFFDNRLFYPSHTNEDVQGIINFNAKEEAAWVYASIQKQAGH